MIGITCAFASHDRESLHRAFEGERRLTASPRFVRVLLRKLSLRSLTHRSLAHLTFCVLE